MSLIASSIPGRLRLRHPALRDSARLEVLRAAVAGWRGVLTAKANAKAGSLLIHYDANKLARERCEARALAAAQLTGTSGAKVGAGGTPPPRGGGAARVRVNRWAKRGMLASLAISLLLAGCGSKRWHALTGALFLHALATHLWAHRRRILQ